MDELRQAGMLHVLVVVGGIIPPQVSRQARLLLGHISRTSLYQPPSRLLSGCEQQQQQQQHVKERCRQRPTLQLLPS